MSRSGLLVLSAAAALIAFLPGDGAAQCSMCRTALEQNQEAAAGFNRAILFLLAMPYAVFASGAGYVLMSRRRKARDTKLEARRAGAGTPIHNRRAVGTPAQ